jgi:hypothetical protein
MRLFAVGILVVSLTALLEAKPPPVWQGFYHAPEGDFYSLTQPDTKAAAWARVGEVHFGFRLVSGTATTLLVRDETDGREHQLQLGAEGASKERGLTPPLPRAEALARVKRYIDNMGRGPWSLLKPGSISAKERAEMDEQIRKSDAEALERWRVRDINRRSADPLPDEEVDAVLSEMQGRIETTYRVKGTESVRRFRFPKMVLAQLPPHVRANLTQADLDALIPEQKQAMQRVMEGIEESLVRP